jgi:hypothetical protein
MDRRDYSAPLPLEKWGSLMRSVGRLFLEAGHKSKLADLTAKAYPKERGVFKPVQASWAQDDQVEYRGFEHGCIL